MRKYARSSDELSINNSTLNMRWSWGGRTLSASTQKSSNASTRKDAAMKRKSRKLDDLPMKYSLAESRSQMATQRSQRSNTAMSVKSTRDESVNMRNLGKRLFEDAVDRANSVGSTDPSLSSDSLQSFPSLSTLCPGSVKATPSYASGHKRQKHNGPTLMGSPLYNKHDLGLYIIRSESSMSFNSRRSSAATAPELKRQMERITSEFRVIPSNVSPSLNGDTNCPQGSPDYLLIPLEAAKTLSTEKDLIMSRSMLEGFRYKTNTHKKLNPKKYISDLLSTGSDMVMSEESVNQSMTVPEVTVQATHTNNLDVPLPRKARRKSSVREEQIKQSKAVHLTSNGFLAVERSRSRPSSACSSRSTRSRSRSPSRGSRCWVDDASTASSRPEFPDDAAQTDEVPSSAAAVAVSQKVLDGVNNLQLDGAINQNICKVNNDKCVDGDAAGVQVDPYNKGVTSLEDLHNQRLSLPDFICPSSEEKSRQAAVREWIEKSSFPWALRTVPLL